MIFLHSDGDDGAKRVGDIVGKASGDVFSTRAHGAALPDCLDAIVDWLAAADEPEIIVVDPASADTPDDRQALKSLRRMAKFKGVDVHLVGDESLRPVADRVVDGSETDESAERVAEQVSAFIHGEVTTPFQRASMDVPTWQEVAATAGLSEADARAKVAWLESQKVWVNNLYQVNVEEIGDGKLVHLIIRRLDRQPIHNWQHFQQIKNEILGDECEAVEIYPRESQLVDEKHHYHLWGFRSPLDSFGIGFQVGRQVRGGK